MTPRLRERGTGALCALAIAATCAVLYADTLHYDFAYDDFPNIVDSPYVRWHELDLRNLWIATAAPTNRRPIAMYSFGLNHYLGGGYDPFGFRVVNVAIHAANAILVFWLARGIAAPRRRGGSAPAPRRAEATALALLAGLLFAVHPLQTNSVTYVVQRMNSLAALFYLAGLLLYVRGRTSASRPGRVLAFTGTALCTALSCGSKQFGITLPLAIWLYEWFFFRDLDRDFARKSLHRGGVPLLVIAGALYYYFFQGPAWGYAKRDFGMGERLLTELRVVVRYLSLIAWPSPARLSLVHDVPLSRSLVEPPTTALALAALLALATGAWLAARRQPLFAFAVAWLFLHLALESSFLPLEIMYEHRTYLPLVGLSIWAPHALHGALGGRVGRTLLVSAAAILALAASTRARNPVWRSSEFLWTDVIAKSPDHPIGYSNLGSALQQQGRYEESLEPFRQALRVDPDFDDAHRGLGASFAGLDRPEEALLHYREAIRLDPDDYQSHGGLGGVLAMLGRFEESELQHRRSLAIYADEMVLTNYARVLDVLGRSDDAIRTFEDAIRLNRVLPDPHLHLGLLFERIGRPGEAARELALAVGLGANGEARTSLAGALWDTGRPAEAIRHLEEAHRNAPDDLRLANNLAWMLATAVDPALRDPARAIELADAASGATLDAGLLDTLGAAYAAAARFGPALEAARRAERVAAESGDTALAAEIRARIALYEASQPYTDPVSQPRGSAPTSLR